MNPEINDNEDIFDVAIGISYFKNRICSSDNIYTYADHFLYKVTYKKLLSFSKKELETPFWTIDENKKKIYTNPKAQNFELRFLKNIFQLISSVKNPLFFAAIIEKKAFKKYYHPVITNFISNKTTSHSLGFLNVLYGIQNHTHNDSEIKTDNYFLTHYIYPFVKDLDTEEKIEINTHMINLLTKNNHQDFVDFILSNIHRFNEQYISIIKDTIKKHNIDINSYNLFDQKFPQDSKSFFISSGNYDFLDKAYDFGFRASQYQFKNLNLPCAIYSYGLNGNSIGDEWQLKFVKKILIDSSLKEIDEFISHAGKEINRLKRYGSHFENIGKEFLHKQLKNDLTELPKMKKPKI